MNISLLGLLIEERKIIKDLLEKKINSNEINWVPITNNQLTILIIQANLLNTVGVKKILSQVDQNVSILSTTADSNALAISQELNIPCLNLKKSTSMQIEQWLSNIKYDQTHIPQYDISFKLMIDELLNSPQQYAICIHQDNTFIVDTKNRKILFNNTKDVELINLFDRNTVKIEHCATVDLSSYKYSMDALLWAWQCLLRYSDIDRSQLPSSTHQLKLIVWPEFIQKLTNGRKDMIVLTACLQKNRLTVNDLIQQTNIEPEFIYKYCYFMITIGYIQSQSNNHECLSSVQSTTDTPSEHIPQYKKLLSHLKKFIGL